MKPDPLVALEKAIESAGTQAKLAAALSTPEKPIKQQNVWNWLRRDKKVPPDMAVPIERATGVPRHELCPDVFPPEEAAA